MPHPRYASEALAMKIAGASSRLAGIHTRFTMAQVR